MSRAIAILSAAAVALVPLSAATARPATFNAHVTIRPATGTPKTTFTLAFTSPDRTGHTGSFNRRDVIEASTTRTAATQPGCGDQVSQTAPSSRAHARVKMKLGPPTPDDKWCAGTYHGKIAELETPVCKPGEPCPAFVILLRTFGRFTFQVRAPHR